MAYVHQIAFDISADKAGELQIGRGLQRVIGFLKSLLPGEPGFVTARAMRSVGPSKVIHVVVQSVWEYWDDLSAHDASHLAEEKILAEFNTTVSPKHLKITSYEEIP